MWFLSDEGIDKKLGYLNSICDLDDPERITYLLRFKHEKLHEWIQLLREQENEERKLTEVSKKAQLLAEFIIKNPKYAKDLIWVIVDLLGHNPLLFCTIDLSDVDIQFLLDAVNSFEYENYPYVILVRYIQPQAREQFVYSLINYADQLQNKMAWAMTGEACETLAFLNCHKEDSMKCLARHLNDDGCDGMPSTNIIVSIPVFKQFGSLIVHELVKYFEQLEGDFDELESDIISLSCIASTKEIALTLLPTFKKALKDYWVKSLLTDSEIWEEYDHTKAARVVLTFYGQLQAIIHGDI